MFPPLAPKRRKVKLPAGISRLRVLLFHSDKSYHDNMDAATFEPGVLVNDIPRAKVSRESIAQQIQGVVEKSDLTLDDDATSNPKFPCLSARDRSTVYESQDDSDYVRVEPGA